MKNLDKAQLPRKNAAQNSAKPVLVFAYGNPSRGDDALATLLIERIQQQSCIHMSGHPVKFLCDYQMQIEHVVDMQGCQRVLLVDAACNQSQMLAFYPVQAQPQTLYTTHGMTASTLLHVYQQVFAESAPLTYMLAISGQAFELGQGLSELAQQSLTEAERFFYKISQANNFADWDSQLTTNTA